MKTYKDFKELCQKHYATKWDYFVGVIAPAAGFGRLQVWLYEQIMKWQHGGKRRFFANVRRAGRVVWWCMIVAGGFAIFQRIDLLTQTTIYKNQTIIARNALYSCQQMPEVCPSAAKLVESVMKR